jgi:hypothetical protein
MVQGIMIQRIMKVCLIVGLISVANFTDLPVSMGANGIVIISLIIGLGLLLLIPSKIYLTILFFQRESEKKKVAFEKNNEADY